MVYILVSSCSQQAQAHNKTFDTEINVILMHPFSVFCKLGTCETAKACKYCRESETCNFVLILYMHV